LLSWMSRNYIITSREKVLEGHFNRDNHCFITGTRSRGRASPGKSWAVAPVSWHGWVQNWEPTVGYGVICHQACYKLLQREFGYRLRFSDVCNLLNRKRALLAKRVLYGEMARYNAGNLFKWRLAITQALWLLSSPLQNKRNRDRILRTWRPLVTQFKRHATMVRKEFPDPAEDAKSVPVDAVAMGRDGKLWIATVTRRGMAWERLSGAGTKTRLPATKSSPRSGVSRAKRATAKGTRSKRAGGKN
jgi:hypothetical protein